MKALLIAIMLFTSATCFSQDKSYNTTMKANIAKMDSVKTKNEMLALSNTFEHIAKTEKNKWQPYYYAALQQILRCYQMEGDELDNLDLELDRADALLASAEVLTPNNSEITCLKSMSTAGRIMKSHMLRGATYGPKSTNLAKEAISQNGNNPRAYFMLAQCTFNTPSLFGGGKGKAKPTFQKSIELFKTFKPETELDPIWGMDMAESLLKQCD